MGAITSCIKDFFSEDRAAAESTDVELDTFATNQGHQGHDPYAQLHTYRFGDAGADATAGTSTGREAVAGASESRRAKAYLRATGDASAVKLGYDPAAIFRDQAPGLRTTRKSSSGPKARGPFELVYEDQKARRGEGRLPEAAAAISTAAKAPKILTLSALRRFDQSLPDRRGSLPDDSRSSTSALSGGQSSLDEAQHQLGEILRQLDRMDEELKDPDVAAELLRHMEALQRFIDSHKRRQPPASGS